MKIFKLKNNLNGQGPYFDLSLCSLNHGLSWLETEYAMMYTRVFRKDFYDDVEIPIKCPSGEEQQTENGHKKYYNWDLSNLISKYENGELFEEALSVEFPENVLVVNLCGDEMFLYSYPHSEYLIDNENVIDVTEEYTKKIIDIIKPDEIEEFVKTHTDEEIEEKYEITDWSI